LAKGETILAKDLPQEVLAPRRAPTASTPVMENNRVVAIAPTIEAAAPATSSMANAYDAIYRHNRQADGRNILQTIEAELIRRAMEETRGNQLRSAMILGINRSTLKKRLNEMREAGIRVFT
ncbi:MAG: helix-turn-helix domain-containing protein, partial [bacterium]